MTQEKAARGRPKVYDRRVPVKFTARQVKRLDLIAQERGINRSDVIRAAVERELGSREDQV